VLKALDFLAMNVGELIYIIVGIDPGIKTGYAILDLNGRLVSSGCEKEASDEDLIRIVSSFGTIVLVASDTRPASYFVKKIAARLNVRVFSPNESMTKIEKRQIGANIPDVHIRDSYAAAVKAYNKYQNKLRQIDSMTIASVKEKEELKKMIIRGHRIAEQKSKHLNIKNELL
jgi:predicted RNase H-like nuclease (RuvC/YqgF family)